MSFLRRLRRKSKNTGSDISKAGEKFAALKNAVEMGLIKLEPKDNKIYLFPELWSGKDKTFINNWCKNVFIYCGVVMAQDFNKALPLHIHDIESNRWMGSWEEKTGFIKSKDIH